MATSLAPIAYVVGIDNVSPVYNPSSRWQVWNMNELYLGVTGEGKYIPKVGDEVHEVIGDAITRFVVVSIHPETLVPSFHQENNNLVTSPFTDDDLLMGVGPGTQSDTYRVYLDRSVAPYRLAVDARLKVGGSMCASCKLFKGANVFNDGIVISGVYNPNGQLISENVPLELVAFETLTNHAIKVVSPCHTTADLVNGELVTAVFYDTLGFVVSKRQLLVENTAFIRSTDANRRYVVGITLETPFLSAVGSRVIQYPLNVPLNALNLVGLVNYNDGSFTRLAVDGTRFSVAGLDAYASTIVGQKSKLVLKYALGANEVAYGAYVGSETHISEVYDIVTTNVNGSYAVQLYAYPVWVDAVSGYRLEWFLYNLDRNVSYNVTPQVRINPARGVYDAKAYGAKQTLSVSVNLKDVNGTYKSFVHVQYVDILLNKPGSERPNLDNIPNWNVSVVSGQTLPYGAGVYATYFRLTANLWKVKLDANTTDQAMWLEKVYLPTAALFDTYRETRAPTPTHFSLTASGITSEYALSDWNTELTLNQSLVDNSTVYLKFFQRTPDTDLQLSIAGMQLFQIDVNGNFV
jgi:hypothetical protein